MNALSVIFAFFAFFTGAVLTFFLLNHKLKKTADENTKLKTEAEFLKTTQKAVKQDFENHAREILKNEADALENKNNALLEPLRNQLKDFRDKMENLHGAQEKERSSLKTHIENLQKMSVETRKSAEHLADALTQNNRQQGSWGEMVLASVLTRSGLREGEEFSLQKNYRQDGQNFRPDAVVHFPNGGDIVIDSKVSLKDYQNYSQNPNDKNALKNHIQSLKNHISGLAAKNYENLEGLRSPDFIFIFVPIEAALLVALEAEPDLFASTLKKNIALVSPSTLMMSLKTVHYIWMSERQNQNAEEIARQAGNLYDKFIGFVDSLLEIDKSLGRAKKNYDDAYNKLAQGSGNLIGRAEKLKALGVASKKELPGS